MQHLTIATSSGIVWLMLVCHFGAALIALRGGHDDRIWLLWTPRSPRATGNCRSIIMRLTTRLCTNRRPAPKQGSVLLDLPEMENHSAAVASSRLTQRMAA